MLGVLFTGGEFPELRHVQRWLDIAGVTVAADSGYDTARALGCEPDLVVGDMDSTERRSEIDLLPPSRVQFHPTDKDHTDTELGIRALTEMGADRIVLIGGGGGRLDHLIGILALFDREVHPYAWVLSGAEVLSVAGRWEASGLKGRTVSFFPVGSVPCRMSSRGLKWPLDGLTWQKGDIGISNVVLSDRVEVDMLSGRLIMVRDLEER